METFADLNDLLGTDRIYRRPTSKVLTSDFRAIELTSVIIERFAERGKGGAWVPIAVFQGECLDSSGKRVTVEIAVFDTRATDFEYFATVYFDGEKLHYQHLANLRYFTTMQGDRVYAQPLAFWWQWIVAQDGEGHQLREQARFDARQPWAGEPEAIQQMERDFLGVSDMREFLTNSSNFENAREIAQWFENQAMLPTHFSVYPVTDEDGMRRLVHLRQWDTYEELPLPSEIDGDRPGFARGFVERAKGYPDEMMKGQQFPIYDFRGAGMLGGGRIQAENSFLIDYLPTREMAIETCRGYFFGELARFLGEPNSAQKAQWYVLRVEASRMCVLIPGRFAVITLQIVDGGRRVWVNAQDEVVFWADYDARMAFEEEYGKYALPFMAVSDEEVHERIAELSALFEQMKGLIVERPLPLRNTTLYVGLEGKVRTGTRECDPWDRFGEWHGYSWRTSDLLGTRRRKELKRKNGE